MYHAFVISSELIFFWKIKPLLCVACVTMRYCCNSDVVMYTYFSLFRLLTCGSGGEVFELDRFLRQCLRSYEHIHSKLFKEMVASLTDTPLVSRNFVLLIPSLLLMRILASWKSSTRISSLGFHSLLSNLVIKM